MPSQQMDNAMTIFETFSPRTHAAILTGLAGGAVAQAMCVWGGTLAHFLPPATLMMLGGFGGAACAGMICAGVIGRPGWLGTLVAVLLWPLVTALGAILGALPFGLIDQHTHRGMLSSLLSAAEEAAPLGLLAVADGIVTSPAVAGIWIVSALAVHAAVKQQRAVTT